MINPTGLRLAPSSAAAAVCLCVVHSGDCDGGDYDGSDCDSGDCDSGDCDGNGDGDGSHCRG